MLRGYSAVVGIGKGQRWARDAAGRVRKWDPARGLRYNTHRLVVKRNGAEKRNRRCHSSM